MKTTLDLPPELVREMKLRAVYEGKKLKDVAAEVIRRGLAPGAGAKRRRHIKLPIIPAPSGAAPFELTAERVHELEMHAETERHEASLRR